MTSTPESMALVNCDIYTGAEVLHDKAIVLESGRIRDLVDIHRVPSSLKVIDLEGACVAPGFIDLQVNGGGDVLFNDDPNPESINKIVTAHRKYGTTSLAVTLITSSEDKISGAISAVKNFELSGRDGLVGLHLEGPFINEKKAGVHPKRFVRRPSAQELSTITAAAKTTVKMVTLAPECVSEEIVRSLAHAGIHVSIGHSDATFDQAQTSFGWGIRFATHLYNAMSAFESRKPGVVGAALLNDKVSCGIIADGHHVHPAGLMVAERTKPPGKLFLVTDAMPPVGGSLDRFRIDDLEIFVRGGACVTSDGTLAGSALDLATAVRNCMQKAGIPLDEALRMASTYPAQTMGLYPMRGAIKPGSIADLAVFDYQVNVSKVFVNGKLQDLN
jgi:N-acetylglucosamine-6-phosphate deacetylase